MRREYAPVVNTVQTPIQNLVNNTSVDKNGNVSYNSGSTGNPDANYYAVTMSRFSLDNFPQ